MKVEKKGQSFRCGSLSLLNNAIIESLHIIKGLRYITMNYLQMPAFVVVLLWMEGTAEFLDGSGKPAGIMWSFSADSLTEFEFVNKYTQTYTQTLNYAKNISVCVCMSVWSSPTPGWRKKALNSCYMTDTSLHLSCSMTARNMHLCTSVPLHKLCVCLCARPRTGANTAGLKHLWYC